MKITVVGGGSTYTPELADGLGRLAPWVTELVLVDPDQTRLAAVGPVSARIMRRHGHPAVVRWTDNLDDGLDGAAAVLIQLRVGGQAARNRDETWPLDYDCVGQETTGAGGLAKALRTVPLVLDIAEQARRRAAARRVDRRLHQPGRHRDPRAARRRPPGGGAVQRRDRAAAVLRLGARHRSRPGSRSTTPGLNHLTWLRGVQVDGKEVLPELLTAHGEEIAEHAGMPLSVLHDLGVVPSYYLRYFYFHDEVVGEERQRPSRAAEVAAIERELMELYGDPTLDRKPELLAKRGGAFYSEAAVALIASLFGDGPGDGGGAEQVVNVRNFGTLPFLADDAVIEVPATITAAGPVPVPVAPIAPLFRGLIAHVSGYEELAIDAALRGGRSRVAAALLAHPLVGQYDVANKMADRLIAENAQFLSWA